MIRLQLKWWLSGPQLTLLRQAAQIWFDKLGKLSNFTLELDPRQCPLSVLWLLAWERAISRLSGESEDLFRVRVQHAFANAQDSGSVRGFQRIFARLGIQVLAIAERVPGKDWDVIVLKIEGNDRSSNQKLMAAVIQSYGRTCRRYEFETTRIQELMLRSCSFSSDQTTHRILG